MLMFLLILWLVLYIVTLSRNNAKQIKRIRHKINLLQYEQEKIIQGKIKETEEESNGKE